MGIKNLSSLYLACNDKKAFFTSSDQSHVRMCVTLYPTYWMIFILYLGLHVSYTEKMLEFRWVHIAHPLLLIYFYTATKEIANGFISSKTYDKRDDFDL